MTARESTDKCASCDQYPIADAIKNGGAVQCATRSEVYRWDDRACVLHNRAPDVRARRDVVKVLAKMDQQQKAATPQKEGNGTDEKI